MASLSRNWISTAWVQGIHTLHRPQSFCWQTQQLQQWCLWNRTLTSFIPSISFFLLPATSAISSTSTTPLLYLSPSSTFSSPSAPSQSQQPSFNQSPSTTSPMWSRRLPWPRNRRTERFKLFKHDMEPWDVVLHRCPKYQNGNIFSVNWKFVFGCPFMILKFCCS